MITNDDMEVFRFVPREVVYTLHWLAGFVVLAEALNKLERCGLLAPGLGHYQRVLGLLKALAWTLLAVGGAGAVVTPLMQLEPPTLQDMAVICGIAVLIIRHRMQEALG